jgi:ribonuclease E
MGIIIRTAGVGRTAEELQWDLDYLMQVWTAIDKAYGERQAPFLIYQESNIVIRALRDYLRNDVGEVLIDHEETFREARQFMELVMPQHLHKLKRYQDRVPLFTRFQIESQIETAFRRQVRLPSGGGLVIDHTEALVSIDINSARATRGSDIEETALNTNLEAAEEVARQLRLRDMGGLIVIDFIDMSSTKNQKAVEDRLRDAVRYDRARIQLGKISRFGLMEMSRQRLRPSLGEASQVVCPRCSGEGRIRGVESLSLSVLRLIEEEAMKERTARVVAQVPVEVGSFLLNEKRGPLTAVEQRCKVDVVIVPNAHMETPDYEIRRLRDDEVKQPLNQVTSYKLVAEEANPTAERYMTDAGRGEVVKREEPAVKGIVPAAPVPTPVAKPAAAPAAPEGPGFFVRLWRALFGRGGAEAPRRDRERDRDRQPSRRDERRGDRQGGRDRDRARHERPRREERRDERRDERRGDQNQRPREEQQRRDAERQRQRDEQRRRDQERQRQREEQQRREAERQAQAAASPAPADADPTVPNAAAAPRPAPAEGGEERRTRRGRRGGRRRRRDREPRGDAPTSGAPPEAATEHEAPAYTAAPEAPRDLPPPSAPLESGAGEDLTVPNPMRWERNLPRPAPAPREEPAQAAAPPEDAPKE